MEWKTNKITAGEECNRALLTRLLDNDLASGEATRLTAHLHGCVACRRAYDETVALRHAVRSLPAPSASRAEAARARVYARLERSVRVAPAPVRPAPVWGLRLAGGLATAGAAAGLLFLTLPGLRQTAPAPRAGAIATSAVAVPLPGGGEMSELFQLHDARSLAAAEADTDPAPTVPAPDAPPPAADNAATETPEAF